MKREEEEVEDEGEGEQTSALTPAVMRGEHLNWLLISQKRAPVGAAVKGVRVGGGQKRGEVG